MTFNHKIIRMKQRVVKIKHLTWT